MNSITLLLILLPTLLNYFSVFFFAKNRERLANRIFDLSSSAAVLSTGLIISLLIQGKQTLTIAEYLGVGFSLRIDGLTIAMYAMVSLIALFVVRFSKNYLEGDPKKARVLARIVAIIASVQLLVLSGNLLMLFLAWMFTSLGLQGLLMQYKERVKAHRAARIKFILARVSDISLLAGFILLYLAFGTGDLTHIVSNVNDMAEDGMIEPITVFLVIAAILKSVQFPFHTWILGVLELPTPVSALLHAGLLNAGPFLMIRFAILYGSSTSASYLLVIFGTLSALYGTLVQVTQPSVKTALVYSSIGHMGFSLLLCGLGLYAAALVHLVSHSFYKAYSFLNAGSVVDQAKRINQKAFSRSGNPNALWMAFITGTLFLIGLNVIIDQYLYLNAGLKFVGNIVVIGIIAMHLQTLDSNSGAQVYAKVTILSLVTLGSFYALEEFTGTFLVQQLPSTTLGSSNLPIFLLLIFYLFAWLQIVVTVPRIRKRLSGFQIHVRNGFYMDSIVNRIAGLF